MTVYVIDSSYAQMLKHQNQRNKGNSSVPLFKTRKSMDKKKT